MSDHTQNDPGILAVKDATRLAVEAAGGFIASARDTAAGKSQLQRCTSRFQPDTISVRDALTLDRRGMTRGGPYILRQMARQMGFAVVALPEIDDDADGVSFAMMKATAELGDVANRLCVALSDGRLEPREAGSILTEWHEMMEAGARLGAILQHIADPEAPPGVER